MLYLVYIVNDYGEGAKVVSVTIYLLDVSDQYTDNNTTGKFWGA